VRRLGHGHEGVVWLVRDASGAQSAVKLIRRGFTTFYASAVADEVATLQRLSAGGGHVHVVQATALWLSPSHLAIQMAFVAGGTLDQYVARKGVASRSGDGARCLPPHEAAYFMRQLLSALAFCHSRRIAFRDVKPENCVLDGSSPPLLALCDFGVSRAFSKKARISMHTIAGTPGFIAPQILSQMFVRGASAGYDGRSADVWSAGAVLCKLLTGHLPYGFEAEFDATLDVQAALHRVWAAARAAPLREFVAGEKSGKNGKNGDGDAARLGEEALEALERMMACDEDARPSAAECAALPWFVSMAVRAPAAYAAALARAEEEQARVEAAHAADPPRRLGARKTAPGEWQDGAMRAFVARAAAAGGRGEQAERLTLLPDAAGASGAGAGSGAGSARRHSEDGGGGSPGGGVGGALAPAAEAEAPAAGAAPAAANGAAAA
jgi:serine/threonine protein kinase